MVSFFKFCSGEEVETVVEISFQFVQIDTSGKSLTGNQSESTSKANQPGTSSTANQLKTNLLTNNDPSTSTADNQSETSLSISDDILHEEDDEGEDEPVDMQLVSVLFYILCFVLYFPCIWQVSLRV